MRSDNDIWFPAKKLGYGWGLPVRWQGWIVLLLYCMLMSGGIVVLNQTGHPGSVLPYMTVITAVLIGICTWKGETSRWPWDKD